MCVCLSLFHFIFSFAFSLLQFFTGLLLRTWMREESEYMRSEYMCLLQPLLSDIFSVTLVVLSLVVSGSSKGNFLFHMDWDCWMPCWCIYLSLSWWCPWNPVSLARWWFRGTTFFRFLFPGICVNLLLLSLLLKSWEIMLLRLKTTTKLNDEIWAD